MPERGTGTERRCGSERVLIVGALVLIVALFCFFLRDVLIPFLRLELRHDAAGAQALLRERGALGFLTVTLVEALQMVVVFIPAEFIQISSGLSYPFPVALLLCDLGVCLGATIIFVLVRTLRFRSTAYEKRRRTLDRLSAGMHARSVSLIMYLLFFMPVIPFGAICYYGSGAGVPYRRYILTVATGVIPSIIVSNLMGAAGRAFLVNGLPFRLLVLIIVLLAAALFVIMFLFLDRFCFRESDQTPDSPVYALIFFLLRLFWCGRKRKPVIEDAALRELEGPYLLLSNHESFYDFYYISQMAHPRNPGFLINAFYTARPVPREVANKAGILSKRLFTPDLGSVAGILRMLRKGFPVVIFPEGRLSPDGRSNPIVEPGARFYKKLGVPLVLVRIRGAYYAAPKWRRAVFRTDIRVTVERILSPEEINALPEDALDALIAETLYTDGSAGTETPIRRGGRAKGLETLLYRCADCGALYTTRGEGNVLRCTACGAAHALDEHYRFTTGFASIPAYYDAIRALELDALDALDLHCAVDTKIFGRDDGRARRETGECRLTRESFSYRSASEEFDVPTANLPALAFSCGTEFELYHGGELHYFYPKSQPQQTARWALAVDLLAQRRRERTAACQNGTPTTTDRP